LLLCWLLPDGGRRNRAERIISWRQSELKSSRVVYEIADAERRSFWKLYPGTSGIQTRKAVGNFREAAGHDAEKKKEKIG
jgi:hypothetical protein